MLVAVGGAAGTAARLALVRLLGPQHGWPVPTTLVNLSGALALGLLLGRLGEPVPVGLQRWRLLVGTGFCGALTTWSTLAVEVDRLARDGRAGLAAAYLLTSVAGGLLAAAVGLALGRRR
ncbi:camphor resistance protein CrcB [Motilibacter rhizosphaerae]|uniref:Fluoride-specific ion channel FluC n=1 Tax=Motilibacter rhizosphaerae TaxID=598652 RepID=A0A4Q7NSM8_9ACTN|nr:camphor resistance protein CrcB [Motilibacter rhizosphaerae]